MITLIYRVGIKSTGHVPSVDRYADFCIKFYISIIKKKIYTLPPRFVENISESDKIILFQLKQLPFIGVQATRRTKQTVPGV